MFPKNPTVATHNRIPPKHSKPSNHHRNQRSQSALNFCLQMAGFSSLSPKMKNLIVAGSLTGFVFGVYFYTMRAVASGDELQVAIDKFEEQKSKV
ncbi:hypothetical protein CMV_011769 [Castanea mollissima]|uniref:Cytochrome c oxidase assembly factor 3 mitochondrial coiled-coil domain-containing protein n=1 Tax=Castanea mollissima TaxID=60419 RepID=A0A8J4RAI6_9ROSI|nr:hypothetical protein CMV_011769 [Castanea mollissima]